MIVSSARSGRVVLTRLVLWRPQPVLTTKHWTPLTHAWTPGCRVHVSRTDVGCHHSRVTRVHHLGLSIVRIVARVAWHAVTRLTHHRSHHGMLLMHPWSHPCSMLSRILTRHHLLLLLLLHEARTHASHSRSHGSLLLWS